MDTQAIVLGVLSIMGAGGGLTAAFATMRHFRSQESVDRRIRADEEATLAATLAALNETLTNGVFEANRTHAQAMVELHRRHTESMAGLQAQHADEIAAERRHCDERLSAMGRRIDEVQRHRAHDLKNYLAAVLSLAHLAKVPADKAAELAKIIAPADAATSVEPQEEMA